MTDWYRRPRLRVLARETLDVSEEYQKKACEEIHPARAKEWEEAQDPSYLLPEYATNWYALTLVECFSKYTREHTRQFAKWWNEHGYEGEVLDLGAGIGASTRLFHELTGATSLCHVYSPGSQLDIAAKIAPPGLVVTNDESAVLRDTRPSGVMAFELFEHVREPIGLVDAVTNSTTQVLCVANSFGARDFGHWRTYRVGSRDVPHGEMGRVFGRAMRDRGWYSQETGFWNARPSIWTRHQDPLWRR